MEVYIEVNFKEFFKTLKHFSTLPSIFKNMVYSSHCHRFSLCFPIPPVKILSHHKMFQNFWNWRHKSRRQTKTQKLFNFASEFGKSARKRFFLWLIALCLQAGAQKKSAWTIRIVSQGTARSRSFRTLLCTKLLIWI